MKIKKNLDFFAFVFLIHILCSTLYPFPFAMKPLGLDDLFNGGIELPSMSNYHLRLLIFSSSLAMLLYSIELIFKIKVLYKAMAIIFAIYIVILSYYLMQPMVKVTSIS